MPRRKATRKASEKIECPGCGGSGTQEWLDTHEHTSPGFPFSQEDKTLRRATEPATDVVTTLEPRKTELFSCSSIKGDPTYSSTISGASYDPGSKVMMVMFRKEGKPDTAYMFDGTMIDGTVRADIGFPARVWQGFKAAGSKGSYFQNMIAKFYKGVKVE